MHKNLKNRKFLGILSFLFSILVILFQEVHSSPDESERRDRFGFFTIRSVAKYLTQIEAVLRKHLRTFEENEISKVIRRTKGKGH